MLSLELDRVGIANCRVSAIWIVLPLEPKEVGSMLPVTRANQAAAFTKVSRFSLSTPLKAVRIGGAALFLDFFMLRSTFIPSIELNPSQVC